jgi:hypothetical protein
MTSSLISLPYPNVSPIYGDIMGYVLMAQYLGAIEGRTYKTDNLNYNCQRIFKNVHSQRRLIPQQ